MGCGRSASAVEPIEPANGDEDATGSKQGGRGDSAVSKGTADSGVVMENREVPALLGEAPRNPPPWTFARVREDGSGLEQQQQQQQQSSTQQRQKSSEILEELLSQGAVPAGRAGERGGRAGEAFSVMLDDGEVIKPRPPARLKPLKARKAQHLPSREEIEEKMRLAEERRKLREDELRTRLRAKSARFRPPATAAAVGALSTEEEPTVSPAEPLRSHLTSDLLYNQVVREAADGEERARGTGGGVRTGAAGAREGAGEGGVGGGRGSGGSVSEDEGEELTRVEELKAGRLLSASAELESDSSFQRAEYREEMF